MNRQELIERAVDLAFRMTGGGMRSRRATQEAAERFGLTENEVGTAIKEWFEQFHANGGF